MFTQSPEQAHGLLASERHVIHKQQRAILAFTITIVGIAVYVLLNVVAQLLPPTIARSRKR